MLISQFATIDNQVCLQTYNITHTLSQIGKISSVEDALNCPCGGYPSIRHNELRDITATLLTKLRHSEGAEPCFQPFLSTRQQMIQMMLV